ncbi:unnamed protein product, partial [Closterium sp. Yama58-4]
MSAKHGGRNASSSPPHVRAEYPASAGISRAVIGYKDYFERTYPGGWFAWYGPILDSRVEASDLPALVSSRERTHVPAFITAYAVASPRPLVYFSILWQPNSKSHGWVVVFNLDGQMFQDALHRRIASGYKPVQ